MRIRHHSELHVYRQAYATARHVFEASRGWPPEERYALTDQARRAARSVCANLAEAWAKRLYPRHFVSKLTDALAEAEEAGVWLDFAHDHGYLDAATHVELRASLRSVCAGLVKMIRTPSAWCIPPSAHEPDLSYTPNPQHEP